MISDHFSKEIIFVQASFALLRHYNNINMKNPSKKWLFFFCSNKGCKRGFATKIERNEHQDNCFKNWLVFVLEFVVWCLLLCAVLALCCFSYSWISCLLTFCCWLLDVMLFCCLYHILVVIAAYINKSPFENATCYHTQIMH